MNANGGMAKDPRPRPVMTKKIVLCLSLVWHSVYCRSVWLCTFLLNRALKRQFMTTVAHGHDYALIKCVKVPKSFPIIDLVGCFMAVNRKWHREEGRVDMANRGMGLPY